MVSTTLLPDSASRSIQESFDLIHKRFQHTEIAVSGLKVRDIKRFQIILEKVRIRNFFECRQVLELSRESLHRTKSEKIVERPLEPVAIKDMNIVQFALNHFEQIPHLVQGESQIPGEMQITSGLEQVVTGMTVY